MRKFKELVTSLEMDLPENDTLTVAGVKVAAGLWVVVFARRGRDWQGKPSRLELVMSAQPVPPGVVAEWIEGVEMPPLLSVNAWVRASGANQLAAVVGGENVCGTVVV